MNILYASCTCSPTRFVEFFRDAQHLPGQQVQKFHRLMLEGLAANKASVRALTAPPVSRANTGRLFVTSESDTAGGVHYDYLWIVNLPVLKNLAVVAESLRRSLLWMHREPGTVVVADYLNVSVSAGAVLAARLLGRPTIAVVTDLPEFLAPGRFSALRNRVGLRVLKQFDGYVFLTDAMADRVGERSAPFIVIEGQVDAGMSERVNDPAEKHPARVFLYAGAISRRYGLDTLVQGFLRAGLPGAELHVYGQGDYVPELADIAAAEPRVRYFGTVLNERVVSEELKASVLVNPRPTHEEFTRYSFPSKNMEYLASGTPVLTTRLPGMPEEYLEHVYLIEDESVDGVCRAITELGRLTDADLHEKGRRARRFALNSKNNIVQSRKVLELAELLDRRTRSRP